MASNQTSNYGLNQWEAADQVLRTEFNADNSKIDAALKGLADQDTELEETLASQAASIAAKGNCQIYATSYTGNGSASRSHSFPQTPQAVLVLGDRFQMIALRPCSSAFNMEGGSYWGASAFWSGNQMRVAYSGGMAGGDSKIGNESGKTYYIVALMGA